VTVREKAPTILTEIGARRLISQARNALVLADDVLARLYQGRAWEVTGHADFVAMCAAELPELRHLKMRAQPRRERVKALRAEGATIPEIAAATGASVGSIHGDLKALEGGHSRAAVSTLKAAGMTSWQRVVLEVGRRGAAGLTCLEFEGVTGWRHGAASAAFHAAERKGHVRRVPSFRQGYAAYVAIPQDD
jgi:hypothetical protein